MIRTELLRCDRDAASVIVRVEGEVDIATAAELDDALARARAAATRALIRDLNQVTLFAVAGVHCLRRAETGLQAADIAFHLVVGDTAATTPVLALMLPIGGGASTTAWRRRWASCPQTADSTTALRVSGGRPASPGGRRRRPR